MRDLKFKCWDKKNKQWLYDFRITKDGGVVTRKPMENIPQRLEWVDYDNVVLTQYTGLKDAFKDPIYEGDIVQHESGVIFEVAWSVYFAGFRLYPDSSDDDELNDQFNEDDSWLFHIIGNIYENPGLLKDSHASR